MSGVRCHISSVMCHVSRVTCQLSPVSNVNSHSHWPSPAYSPIMHSRLVFADQKPDNISKRKWSSKGKSLKTSRWMSILSCSLTKSLQSTGKQVFILTLQLTDWIGPEGQFSEEEKNLGSTQFYVLISIMRICLSLFVSILQCIVLNSSILCYTFCIKAVKYWKILKSFKLHECFLLTHIDLKMHSLS